MNLTKLAKKLVQDNRDKKKNTDSSAGFHQNQLNLSVYFYLSASFCPVSVEFILWYLSFLLLLHKKEDEHLRLHVQYSLAFCLSHREI